MTQSCSLVFVSYLCLSYIFVSLKYLNNYTSLNQHFRNIAACTFVHSALDRALDKDLYVSEAWMLQHGGTKTLLQRTVCNTVTETSQIWPQTGFLLGFSSHCSSSSIIIDHDMILKSGVNSFQFVFQFMLES